MPIKHLDQENLPLNKDSSIPIGVWIIGGMMFLINLSFVIMYSLSAVYMKNVVGVSTAWIGFLEGFVEAASYAAKLLSGVISDYLRRRKVIMVIGYLMMVLARPILAMSNSFLIVFIARMLERVGNGVQSTPRDALVGDIAPPKRRGAAFGLKRSLATAGSFLGGAAAIVAMKATSSDYNKVFWIATIPAVLAILILFVWVKEPKKHAYPQKLDPQETIKPTRQKIQFSDLGKLGKYYWMLMGVVFMFMLARFGETFLMLHANRNFGLSEDYVPVIMMLYNATYCLSSYPIAALSDRMNRYAFMALGIFVLVVADIVLFTAPNLPIMFIGVALWGLQIGVIQSVSVALIIDLVPEHLRGTALGFFYLISAISSVIAGIVAGNIAEQYGEYYAFFASAIVAIIALATLFAFMPRGKNARPAH